jgi:hypothetical protein
MLANGFAPRGSRRKCFVEWSARRFVDDYEREFACDSIATESSTRRSPLTWGTRYPHVRFSSFISMFALEFAAISNSAGVPAFTPTVYCVVLLFQLE